MKTTDRTPAPPERPSRRSVVAGLGCATAAAITSASAAVAGTSRVATRGAPPLRVGLIGCGSRGRGAAKNALMATENVTLVAVADVFPDPLRAALGSFAADPEIRGKVEVPPERAFVGLDAYQRLLATDVDYVVHATPPGFRPLHLGACIDAGKHVFVEKPVAVDGPGLRGCLAAAAAAKRKGLAVGVGLQRRHDPRYVELVDRLRRGDIGEIVSARCYWNQGTIWVKRRQPGWSDLEWQLRNWYYFSWLSGDHIVEQHIHNIDVVLWVLGQTPVAAVGMGGRQQRTDPAYGNIYDHFAVDFEMPSGLHVTSMCRQMAGAINRVSEHFVGTRGQAHTGGGMPWGISGKKRWNPDRPEVDSYVEEHRSLIESIRRGTPLSELEAGTQSTAAAIMGRTAAYTGRRVTFDEIMSSPVSLVPERIDWKTPLPVAPVPVPGVS